MNPSFLQTIAREVVAAYGTKLDKCAFVFNNKRPEAYLKSHLAAEIKLPFFSPAFFTIQSFFEHIHTTPTANRFTQLFILHRCYNQLLKVENERATEIASFLKFGSAILSDFGELDRYLVDAPAVFKELEDIAIISEQFSFLTSDQASFLARFWASYYEGKDKQQQLNFIKMWRRMPHLYENFHRALAEQNLSTLDLKYRQVAENPSHFHSFFKQFEKIFFIGFNAISTSEARVFNFLQQEGLAAFYFDVDPFYMENKLHESGGFIRKNMEAYGLKNSLPSAESLLQKEKNVHVYEVEGQVAQAKALASLLPELISAKQLTDGTTAIVLADESLLLPLLQSLPEEVGGQPLQINVTMGISFTQLPLFTFISDWIALQTYFFKQKNRRSDVVPFELVHPMLLNNYSRLGGTAERIEADCLHAKSSVVSLAVLRRQNAVSELFFEWVQSGKDIPAKLSALLQRLSAEASKAEHFNKVDSDILQHVYTELSGIEEAMLLLQPADAENGVFILNLLKNAIQNLAVPLAGNIHKGIQIMGVLETRSLDFKNIIFLGFNEGLFPKINAPQSFIPYNIRKAFGLRVIENQDAIAAYLFYRSIQRAENIFLFYNNITNETITGEVSRFLRQIEFETNYRFQYATIKSTVTTQSKTPTIIEKTPAVMQKLNALFDDGGRSLSPSAFLTYLLNPPDFFYRYVAGIREPENVETVLDTQLIGNLFHDFMHDVYADLSAGGAQINRDKLMHAAKELQSMLDTKLLPKLVSVSDGKRAVITTVVRKFASSVLDCDMENAPFTIIGLEQEVGPVKFEFTDKEGRKRTISLKGKIDRIDRLSNGQLRIVDYKTGSDDHVYGSVEGSFDNRQKINKAFVQTMLYAWMYQMQYKELPLPVLYVLKNLQTTSGFKMNFETKMSSNSSKLTSDSLNGEMEEFLKYFRSVLVELSDSETPFVPGRNEKNYNFSPYMQLLNI